MLVTILYISDFITDKSVCSQLYHITELKKDAIICDRKKHHSFTDDQAD